MKVIDAYWEKRNLGVDAVEFEVDETDTASVVEEILANEKQYNVVKIPSRNTEVTQAVQQYGYRFAEVMNYFAISPGELKLNRIQQRIVDSIEILEMNNTDIDELHKEINNNLFDTDRIYCDPLFTKEQAANRYWGWISDEQSRGGKLLKYVYKQDAIGFAGVSRNKTCYLSGLYPKAKRGGFGVIIPYIIYQLVQESGKREPLGIVSSTNVSVWRLYEQLGFALEHMEYIFIKHN